MKVIDRLFVEGLRGRERRYHGARLAFGSSSVAPAAALMIAAVRSRTLRFAATHVDIIALNPQFANAPTDTRS